MKNDILIDYLVKKRSIALQKQMEKAMQKEIIEAVKMGAVKDIESMLDRKPSLIKARDSNGHSLFWHALYAPVKSLEVACVLEEHLYPHRENRDKGYTPLFPECDLLMNFHKRQQYTPQCSQFLLQRAGKGEPEAQRKRPEF